MNNYTLKKGIGAFLYPEVTINNYNANLGFLSDGKLNVLYNTDYKGKTILVTDDGFIGIIGIGDENWVIGFLNLLFASAQFLLEIHGYSITLGELCYFEYNEIENNISITFIVFLERNFGYLLRKRKDDWFNKKHRQLITINEIERLVNFCKYISDKKDARLDLVLLFEGYTLSYRGGYTAGYLFGWMIIETFISKIWKDYVKSNQSSFDKNNLNTNRLKSYNYIENLSSKNKMSEQVKELLHSMRDVRNKIVHEKITVDEKEALKCLKVAKTILWNRIFNPQLPFKYLTKNESNNNIIESVIMKYLENNLNK